MKNLTPLGAALTLLAGSAHGQDLAGAEEVVVRVCTTVYAECPCLAQTQMTEMIMMTMEGAGPTGTSPTLPSASAADQGTGTATGSATSSATGSATGSDLVIGGVHLHGVVVHGPTSPLSCYHLPTPTADLVEVEVDMADNFAIVTGIPAPADLDSIMILYMSPDTSQPVYLASFGDSGTDQETIIDISGSGGSGLAVVLPDDSSVVFGDDGIHLFNPTCTNDTFVEIPDFGSQLEAAAKRKRSLRLLAERAGGPTATGFNASIEINKDQDVDGVRPSVIYGGDNCTLSGTKPGPSDGDSEADQTDILTFRCPYPASNRSRDGCDGQLGHLTAGYPDPSDPTLHNPINALAVVGIFLEKAGAELLKLFATANPNSDPAGMLGSAFRMLEGAFAALGAALEMDGAAICAGLRSDDRVPLVIAGPDFGTSTVGLFSGLPTASLFWDLATHHTGGGATATGGNPSTQQVSPVSTSGSETGTSPSKSTPTGTGAIPTSDLTPTGSYSTGSISHSTDSVSHSSDSISRTTGPWSESTGVSSHLTGPWTEPTGTWSEPTGPWTESTGTWSEPTGTGSGSTDTASESTGTSSPSHSIDPTDSAMTTTPTTSPTTSNSMPTGTAVTTSGPVNNGTFLMARGVPPVPRKMWPES